MATGKVRLDISVAEYPHTARLLSGEIEIEGVEPNFIRIVPQIGAYRRMVREVAFDVCELAPTTYIIARALGAPFVALPVFTTRRFHHSGLLVRPNADIRGPKDLEGQKVGVRAYSVTTGVWTRAIFVEEYGLDSAKVTWVVDDEEHVEALKLPPNVERAPEGRSLYDMMVAGELVAGFSANAGIGRTGSPTSGGWRTVETPWPEMFPDAAAREAEWFARTGIYPMHGTIVVKDEVLAAHPWVARSLSDAFSKAKAAWLADLHAGNATTPGDLKYLDHCRIVGPDPLPFGMAENRATVEALQRAAWDQKLTPRLMPVDEIFVDPERI